MPSELQRAPEPREGKTLPCFPQPLRGRASSAFIALQGQAWEEKARRESQAVSGICAEGWKHSLSELEGAETFWRKEWP